MNAVTATPGQTIGPFFHYALPYEDGSELVPASHVDAIRLHGTVLDGAGSPVLDALIEVWQADPEGRIVQEPGSLNRDSRTFTGWGRSATDSAGNYSFSTLLPGATSEGAAPFFAIAVFARGLLDRLFTRAYVPGHPSLASDALLASLPSDRRDTLIASADDSGLAFDIRLQGERETVFLTHTRR